MKPLNRPAASALAILAACLLLASAAQAHGRGGPRTCAWAPASATSRP